MTVEQDFASLLGMYRVQCGLTQEGLGAQIGVHRNTIRKWEDRSSRPQVRGEVLRLADVLQLEKEERRDFLMGAGFRTDRWPVEIWTVPHQRNRFFVGREAVLQSLHRSLIPGGKVTALTQAISGLGGIGKTRTAVEYAHSYSQYYEAVLWVQADSHKTLIAAYLKLATDELGLTEQQEAEVQIEAVKHWLQTHRGWLLILDNVEEPQDMLSTFLPSKHQGSVLITTRRQDMGPLAHSEVLPLFSPEEAVLFVLRRARRIAPQASVKEASPEDVLHAEVLYVLLGGLPLALEQACAYIDANRCSLLRYMELYQQKREQLLDRYVPVDHRDSVLMTFWLSWEEIRHLHPLAGMALECCAFLAPEQIPEVLVQEGIALADGERAIDELALDEVLGLLHRYSLVERAGKMLSIHRLVQEVLQEVLIEGERRVWMERTVRVLSAFFPNGEYETWAACNLLLLHGMKCRQWIEDVDVCLSEAAWLLTKMGRYVYERGLYSEAEPLMVRALQIAEEQSGAKHPNMAGCLNNLAELYREQDRYGEAEPLYKRALQIAEEQLGDSHPDTAMSLALTRKDGEPQGQGAGACAYAQAGASIALVSQTCSSILQGTLEPALLLESHPPCLAR